MHPVISDELCEILHSLAISNEHAEFMHFTDYRLSVQNHISACLYEYILPAFYLYDSSYVFACAIS